MLMAFMLSGMMQFTSFSQGEITLHVDASIRNDSLILDYDIENTGTIEYNFGVAQFALEIDDTSGLAFSQAAIIEEGFWGGGNTCYRAMTLGQSQTGQWLNVQVNPEFNIIPGCDSASLLIPVAIRQDLATVGIPIEDCDQSLNLSQATTASDVRTNWNGNDLEAYFGYNYALNFNPASGEVGLNLNTDAFITSTDTVFCESVPTVDVVLEGLGDTTRTYDLRLFDASLNTTSTLSTLSGSDTVFSVSTTLLEAGDSVFVVVNQGSCNTSTKGISFLGTSGPTASFEFTQPCLGDTTFFVADTLNANFDYFYNFDDPTASPADTADESSPGYVFQTAGARNVTLTITDLNGCIDDTTETILIYDFPTPDLGGDTTLCDGDTIILDAGTDAAYEYDWKPLSGAFDANVLGENTFQITVADTFVVLLDSNGIGCSKTDTIVILRDSVDVLFPGDTAACANSNFNISMIGGVGVTYRWEDFGGNLLGTNPILPISLTIADEQVIAIANNPRCELRDTIDIDVIAGLNIGSIPEASASQVSADSVVFTWPEVNGASEYRIYLSIDGILVQDSLDVGLDTTYGVGGVGLVGIDSLSFTYQPISNCGTPKADSASIVIGFCDQVPTIIDSAIVVGLAADSIAFGWDSIPNATGYNISYSVNAGAFVDSINHQDTVFTVDGLTTGDSIVFRFNAVAAGCNESDSAVSIAIAYDCDVNFADIDSSRLYCTSSFNVLLEPDTLTSDMFFAGSGVNLANDTLWYINPADAGAGTHLITLTGCYGIETHVDTIRVQGAPCIETVDSTTINVPFSEPAGIYTDCDGQIYFTDFSENSIIKIDTFGIGSLLAGGSALLTGFLDGPAPTAKVNRPVGVIVHPATQIVYFADFTNHAIRSYDPNTNFVATLAGGGPAAGTDVAPIPGDSDDPSDADGLANRQFTNPYGLTFNRTYDTIFITDQSNFKVKSLALSDNTVRLVAGTGAAGTSDGPSATSSFQTPTQIKYDRFLNRLYVGDAASFIRYIDLATDEVVNMPSTPDFFLRDGLLPVSSHANPIDVAPNDLGDFFILDNLFCSFRKYNLATDSVETLFGATPDVSTVLNACTTSPLSNPTAMSVFVNGFVDITDTGNDRVLRVAVDDFLNRPLDELDTLYCQGDVADTLAFASVAGGYSISPSIDSMIYVANGQWVFEPRDTGSFEVCFTHQVGPCAGFECKNIYVSGLPEVDLGGDTSLCSVQEGIFRVANDLDTLASYSWTYSSTGTTPFGTALSDTNYFIFISDTGFYAASVTNDFGCTDSDTVRVGGSPDIEFNILELPSGAACAEDTVQLALNVIDPGAGLQQFIWSTGDLSDTISINESGDYFIRVIDSVGCFADTSLLHQSIAPPIVSIGSAEKQSTLKVNTFLRDSLLMEFPRGVIQDGNGDFYVSNENNHTIIKIVNGTPFLYAGRPGTSGYIDISNRFAAAFNRPAGLALDKFDNLYIADAGNNVVRRIDANTGAVTTFAGNQHTFTTFAQAYADGRKDTARFFRPLDITFDGAGFLYIADSGNHAVRVLNPVTNIVSTLGNTSGVPVAGSVGDFNTVEFASPSTISFYQSGKIFVGQDRQIHELDINTPGGSAVIRDNGTIADPEDFSSNVTGFVSRNDRTGIFAVANDDFILSGNGSSTNRVIGIQGTSGFVDGDTSIARVSSPMGLSFSNDLTRLFIADKGNSAIREAYDSCYVDVCQNDSVELTANPAGGTYLWSGPSGFTSTSRSIVVQDPGLYEVQVNDGGTGCLGIDSIRVNQIAAPIAILDTSLNAPIGVDTIFYCAEDTITFYANLRDTSLYDYQWFTVSGGSLDPIVGANDTLINISGVSGSLVLGIRNATGCFGLDTTVVLFNPIITPVITSSADSLCPGDTATLTVANVGTGPGITNFLWNTGDTTNSIRVGSSGIYSVVLTDSNACGGDTSFTQIVKNLPIICIEIDTSLKSVDGARYNDWYSGTLAGIAGSSGVADGDATTARFNNPWGLWLAGNNLWVTGDNSGGNNLIKRIDLTDTTVSTLIGGGGSSLIINDTLEATNALLGRTTGIVQRSNGEVVFISDGKLYAFRNDSIFLYVGGGASTNADGFKNEASFDLPKSLAIDDFDNIYVADYNNHNIKVIRPGGFVEYFAGDTSNAPVSGSVEGKGPDARFNWPFGVEVGTDGLVYVAQEGGQIISKIGLDTNVTNVAGAVTTSGFNSPIAGTAVAGSDALFSNPWNLRAIGDGRFILTDGANHAIRLIQPDDSVVTILGNGVAGSADGIGNNAQFSTPADIAWDASNKRYYIADKGNHTIRTIEQNKNIRVCASDSVTINANCTDADSYSWVLRRTGAVVSTDSAFVAGDSGTYVLTIVKDGCINSDSVVVEYNFTPAITATTLTDSICQNDSTQLFVNSDPAFTDYAWTIGGSAIISGATDTAIFVLDPGQYIITATDTNGCSAFDTIDIFQFSGSIDLGADIVLCPEECTTLDAGTGFVSYVWSDSSTAQTLEVCAGTVFDVEVTDTNDCILRDTIDVSVQFPTEVSITPGNRSFIRTIAGDGSQGNTNDLDPLSSSFDRPSDVTVDSRGIIYIADRDNGVVRRIDTTGAVSTFMGNPLTQPTSVAVDKNDNIYVANFEPSGIYKITPAGVISLYAGDTSIAPGTVFREGRADTATFFHPFGVAVDESNRVFVADAAHHAIRVIDPRTKMVSSVGVASPGGFPGYVDGDFNTATFNHPGAIEVNLNGDLYTGIGGDGTNTLFPAARIRKIDFHNQEIYTYNTSGNDVPYNSINQGIAADEHDDVHASTAFNFLIDLDNNDSIASRFAGSGLIGGTDDFDTLSRIHSPLGVHFDKHSGLTYFVEGQGHRVRAVVDSTELSICPGDSLTLSANLAVPTAGQFVWNTGDSTASITTDSAGWYVVQFTDANTSCISYDSILVAQRSTPVFSVLTQDTTLCLNDSANLVAQTLVPTDSIYWNFFDGSSLTELSFNVGADTLFNIDSSATFVVIADNGTCDFSDTVTVILSDLNWSVNPTADSICLFDSLLLDASTSTSFFGIETFAWDTTGNPGEYIPGTLDNDSLLIIPSTAGLNEYVLTITDSNGCQATDTVTILVADTISITFDTDTALVCSGGQLTRVSANLTGGLPGFEYNWFTTAPGVTLSNSDSSAVTISNLATLSDTFMLYLSVNDTLGCGTTDSITLRVLDFQIQSQPDFEVICSMFEDSIRTTILNDGVGPYGIQWIDGDSLSDTTIFNPIASPTNSNQYIIQVLDSSSNCIATDTFDISVDSIIANAGLDQVICLGDTASLDASGSSGAVEFLSGDPHMYLWSLNNGAGDTIAGTGTSQVALVAGGVLGDTSTYYLQITDSIGCTDVDSVNVIWNTGLAVNTIDDTIFLCKTEVDTLMINRASGASPPYSYAWSVIGSGTLNLGATLSDTSILANYSLADITDTSLVLITVTDTNGCSGLDTLTVIGTDLDVVATAQFDTICPGTDDSLFVSINGGIGPYRFTWDNQTVIDDSTAQNTFANIDTTTTFTVVVFDSATGCVDTASITVVVEILQAQIGLGIGPDTIIVCAQDTALLDASLSFGGTAFGGTSPYQYSWNRFSGDGNGVTGPLIDTNITLQTWSGTPGSFSDFELVITDSLGCQSSDTTTIFWNSQVNSNLISDSLFLCRTESDTLLVNQASGGLAPYDYGWSVLSGTVNLGTQINDTSIIASYSLANITDTSEVLITITDTLGCTSLDTITVIGTNLQVTAFAEFDTICPNLNDSIFTVVDGGVGPYIFTWDNQSVIDDSTAQNTFANIDTTTTFTVVVFDVATGCSDTASVTIVIEDLQAQIGGMTGPDTLAICFGDTTILDASSSFGGTAFGGLDPYEYSWNRFNGDGNGVTGPTVDTNVTLSTWDGTPGSFASFELMITDSLGCQSVDTTTIYWNTNVASIPFNSRFIACVGLEDTLRALPATGGLGGYVYTWNVLSGSATLSCDTCFQSVFTVNANDTSLVLLQVFDSVGCSDSDTIRIVGRSLEVDATNAVPVICPGIADTLGVDILQDGEGPYAFTWSPLSNLSDPNARNPIATPLSTQMYTVTVFDSTSRCLASDSIEVVVNQLNALATIVGNPVEQDTLIVCFNDIAPDLTANLSNGGTPFGTGDPYAYAWSSNAVNVSFNDTTLHEVIIGNGGLSGSFEVYVRVEDAIGCFNTDTITVIWNDSIAVDVSNVPVSLCVDDTLSLNSIVTGGTAGYTYDWSIIGSSANIDLINPLNVDSVAVTASGAGESETAILLVTDTLGCQNTDSVLIESNIYEVSLTAAADTVCSNTQVVLTATNTIGTGPFSYSWDGVSFEAVDTNAVIVAVTSSYSVVGIDSATGCTDIDSVTIVIEELTVTIGNENGDTLLCFADSIIVLNTQNITGGTLPYESFVWNGSIDTNRFVATAPVTGLTNGSLFTLEVTDTLGCVGRDSITIYRNPEINIDLAIADTSCLGDTIALGANQITGGNANNLSVSWTSDRSITFLSTSDIDPRVVLNDGDGDYELAVFVTDLDIPACRDSNTLTLTVRTPPVVAIPGDSTICSNDTLNLDLDDYNVSFDGTHSYAWFLENTDLGLNQDSIAIVNAGTHTIVVTDRFGCSGSDSIEIFEDPAPQVGILANDTNTCSNQRLLLIASVLPAGGSISWTEDGGGALVGATDDTVTYIPSFNENGVINISVAYSNACGIDNDTIQVQVNGGPIAQMNIEDTIVPLGALITYVDSSISITGNALSAEWRFENTLGGTNVEIGTNPPDQLYDIENTYLSTLISRDIGTGCQDTTTVTVSVDPRNIIYVPNVFSPQATNIDNQTLRIFGQSISTEDFIFRIYNRWGELVYESSDLMDAMTIGWDGKYEGAAHEKAVFTYTLEAKFLDGSPIEQTGTITLLK